MNGVKIVCDADMLPGAWIVYDSWGRILQSGVLGVGVFPQKPTGIAYLIKCSPETLDAIDAHVAQQFAQQ